MKRLLACALLALTSAAFGATLNPVQLLNPTGSTAGQAIVSTGPTTAPGWSNITATSYSGILPVANGGTNSASASGTALDNITSFAGTGFLTRTGAGAYAFQSTTNGITLGNLAQTAANTVLANATGSPANLTAFSMPSCSATTSALQWTSGTGFVCNASVNATVLLGFNWAIPGAIGSTTPNTGTFTTLKASNSKVIASNSTSQSIANSTQTTITGWTSSLNQGANFVPSTGVYTVPAAGTYDIRAAITLTPAVSVIGAQVLLEATVNGVVVQITTLTQQLNGNTFQSSVTGAFRVVCNAGDLITLRVLQTTGASMTLNGGSTVNWLSIEQEP